MTFYDTCYHNKKHPNGPNSWSDGWQFDRSYHTAPQFTSPKNGVVGEKHPGYQGPGAKRTQSLFKKYSTTRAQWNPIGGFRETYIDQHVMRTTGNPGSGAHRTRTEFIVNNVKGEVDDNHHCKDTVPRTLFPRTKSERFHNNVKLMARKPSSMFSPGPGAYHCRTFIGGDNGGLRRSQSGPSAGRLGRSVSNPASFTYTTGFKIPN